MILEIHAHTSRYSKCSTAGPVQTVRHAFRKGMQGIILTEHHFLWPREDIDLLRIQSEVPESFLIMSGQEVATDIGHVLVYGAPRTIEKKIPLRTLRKLFPEAALVWAHPFRSGSAPSRKRLLDRSLDAVEIFNLNQSAKENYTGLKLWHEYKFTAVAGSDTHAEGDTGVFSTQLTHPVSDIKGFAGEIRRGRCLPFVKEIPKAGTHVILTEITMGTKGADERRTRLITRHFYDEKKWKTATESLRIREFLFHHGFGSGKYRVPKTVDVDEPGQLIIEEGQRGDNLFDTIGYVSPVIGIKYFYMSAEWLAKLHGLKFKAGRAEDTFRREEKRFVSYRRTFSSTNSPYEDDIAAFIDRVRDEEGRIFSDGRETLVRCHGDYHPKNIIIGQDRARDINTLFISVIDFDSSVLMPPEFDVGYFISQFLYQFRDAPRVLREYSPDRFIRAYRNASGVSGSDFGRLVKLFRLRANLSIASFLVKVGKGESPDMRYLINESRALCRKW